VPGSLGASERRRLSRTVKLGEVPLLHVI